MSRRLDKIPILMYHQIAEPIKGDLASERYCIPPRVFARHMLYLRLTGHTSVSIPQIARYFRGEGALPRRPVAITFDDGYLNTYTHAFPILRRYGFNATVYLVAGCIGKTNRWDEAEGFLTARLMNEDQIRDMDRKGIEFGVHTFSHPHLAKMPTHEVVREIKHSKGCLEEMIGKPMYSFSYPYGETSFSKKVRSIVISSGFLAACGTDPGCNAPDEDLFYLRRHFPKAYTNLRRFAALMGKMPCDYHTEADYWA